MRHYGQFYINGQWVDPVEDRRIDLVNPANEEIFATVAIGSATDVDRAVAAARAALPAFSATSPTERQALLRRIIESYRKREADLARVIVQEMGAPVSVNIHVTGPVGLFEDNIKLLETYPFESVEDGTLLRREAIGVCGLITPWNWPVQAIVVKLASALAAGCTIVLKPSEYSPLCAIILAEILHDAGTPPGVFNLVNGDGPGVGTAIAAHPDIDMVSFTGSTRAGILVAEAAAPSVKRVTQELGGKSANIVLPDADLESAARWSVSRAFFNSSQSCHCPSRILVPRDRMEEFVGYMADEARKFHVGDPSDPATTMGPVVNRSQFNRIQAYIQSALDEGATLVTGGPGRPAGLERGFYVQPTVFADVRPDMTIAREEIFGPVLAVIPYDSEDEALAIANNTEYGLGAYLFTNDSIAARRIGQTMRAGRVFLNGDAGNMSAPMGGYRKSGNGRELGRFGLEEYLEVKAMFGYQATA